MRLGRLILTSGIFLLGLGASSGAPQAIAERGREAYLSWNAKQAEETGKSMQAKGRVGGWFDARVVHTEHAYNYKLRATWLTPEVIRATARLRQIQNGLTDEETRALVTQAENAGDTVILIEIDPREGSGVIPREWVALLRSKDTPEDSLGGKGIHRPELRDVKALAGTARRDYAYDIFWVVFPLVNQDGEPLFPPEAQEAELVVRISNKEGRVQWRVPESIRERARRIAGR